MLVENLLQIEFAFNQVLNVQEAINEAVSNDEMIGLFCDSDRSLAFRLN